MGIVFQDFNKYELSIRENIGLADTEKINSDNELYQVLKVVGMDKEFGSNLDVQMGNWFGGRELSKGQWQRIAIARALFTHPDLLLADEPTGALDSNTSNEILELFDEVNANGQTIIMVTHSAAAASHAKRTLFIKDGRIYHELYRGDLSLKDYQQQINQTMMTLTNGGE